MPRFQNPYAAYTPIGQGLTNIASTLLRTRNQPNRQAEVDAHAQNYEAETDLRREQTRKTAVERQLAERMLRDQGAEAQDELIAAASGQPAYMVRAYRDALAGTNTDYPIESWADVATKISRAMLAVRPAYADKTIDPRNIAASLDTYSRMGDRERLMAGEGPDATTTSGAYFATGASNHAPFASLQGGRGSLNVITGDNKLNEVGQADVRATDALAGERTATAGLRTAQTGKANLEARNISQGFFGPSITVDDGQGNAVPVFLGQVAGVPGVRTAVKPRAVAPRDDRPQSLNSAQTKQLNAVVASLFGGTPDEADRVAITARAAQLATDPKSPHFRNPDAAAQAAIAELAPDGFEEQGAWNPFKANTFRIKRPDQPGATPAPRPIPRALESAVPPNAAGKSHQQLIDEANDAIRRGADRNKVMDRLRKLGVPVA